MRLILSRIYSFFQQKTYKKKKHLVVKKCWHCKNQCVYVCVCVRVCVYFLSTYRLLLTEQNSKSNAQFTSAMVCCGNISVSSIFIFASKEIIERTFKLATVCQLNRAKPREVKDKSYKLSGLIRQDWDGFL